MVLAAKIVGDTLSATEPRRAILPYWSFTKTLLAAATFALARNGRIDLDAPWRGRPFTLRQLLSHRAGLPDYGGLADYHAAVARGDTAWPLEQLLIQAKADRPLFAPGERCAYSNIGYAFVRQQIEESTGADLDRAMRSLVFDPLGVEDVRIALSPADMGDIHWPALRSYDPNWVYHGLAVGTASAAALLLHRLMTTDFLPRPIKDQMFRRTPLAGPVTGRPFVAPSIGTGVMIDPESPLGLCVGHTGGGPGSVCAICHFPDLDPVRTVAAFVEGDDLAATGDVERAALALAADEAALS